VNILWVEARSKEKDGFVSSGSLTRPLQDLPAHHAPILPPTFWR
jgi:hypothetical protein